MINEIPSPTASSTEAALPSTGERFLPGQMTGDIELEHLHRYLMATSLAENKVVLDIASGEGYGSNMLAQIATKVIGVDISEEAIAHARSRYPRDNLEFRHGSCAAIPVENAAVDLIVSFETLEHHQQHEEMIQECRRVLKPGGILVISTPDKLEYTDIPRLQNPFHVKELYISEFRELLSSCFPYVVLHGQKICYGSIIAAEGGGAERLLTISGNTDNFAEFPSVQAPVYAIALASDNPLSNFPYSIFDDTKRFLTIHKQALSDQLQLKAQLLQSQNEITRVKSSLSWKITKPLRFIANFPRLLRERFAFRANQ